MEDADKTKEQLILELTQARQQIAKLKVRDAERKRIEEALHRSEALLKQAQHVAHVGSWVWNIKTNTLEWSDEMYRIFGIDKHSFTGFLPDVIEQAIHPDDRPSVEASNLSVIQKKKPIPVEYRITRPTGEIRTVWAEAGELLLDNEGNPELLPGIVQDISKRKEAEAALHYRADFEHLIVNISSEFINLSSDRVDKAVNEALKSIGQFIGADHSYIFLLQPDGVTVSNTHEWCADGINPEIENLQGIDFEQELPWVAAKIHRHEDIFVARVADLPPEANQEKAHFQAQDIQSLVAVPMIYAENAMGFLGFDAVMEQKAWSDDSITLLRLVGEIIVNTLKRKQMEEALQESEERARFITENAQDMLYRMSVPDGVYEYVSPASVQLFGYTPEEFYDNSLLIEKVIHPDWVSYFEEEWEKILKNQMSATYEYQIIDKSGEVRWMHQRNTLIRNDEQEPSAIVGVVTDITERKETEKALYESRQYLDDLMASLSDVVFTVKMPEREIEYVNPTITKVLGYTPEEVIGQSTRLFYPDDAGHLEFGEKLAAALAKGETLNTEHQFIRQNGELFCAEVTVTFRYHYEKLIQVISVMRDITGRKEVEEQERQLTLERERAQILSNFITQASHEFRTPLATINTSAYLVNRVDNSLVRQRHSDKIQLLVSYLSTLVEALMTMAKLDGIRELARDEINLDELLQAIYASKQGVFQARNIQPQIDLDGPPVKVLGNWGYLQKVFNNLLDNALKFTPDGETIKINRTVVDQHVHIEFIDTGRGISADEIARIFERFYRTDKSGTTRGFGLGLSIAKRVVELHSGQIEVESRAGKGSIFRVILPYAR